MSVIGNIYGKMNDDHQKLINDNQEYLENILDYAIIELAEIAEDNEICLVNDGHICETYEEIFNCLKQRSIKRMNSNK